MRKDLTTILPLAVSLLLILLPPALTGRLRMFAATPLRPVGEGRRMLAANVNQLLGTPSTKYEAALVEENERLRQELAHFGGRLRDTRRTLAEYGVFSTNRRQYGLTEGNIVDAAIIFKGGTGPMRRTVYIDGGSLDGLGEGMPVVCGRALVGVIIAVGPAMSEVMILGDPRLKIRACVVPAAIDETSRPPDDRVAGILTGTSKGDVPLRLCYIWRQVDVNKGDVVITTGCGGRFPRGLVVGRVRSVARQRDDLHHLIEVAPEFDFEQIDRVFVLADWPAEFPPEREGEP